MKAFTLASLSGAVTAALTLGATAGLAVPFTANAAELKVNGAACGSYTQATFTGAGALALAGVQNCELGGGGAVTPPGDDEDYRFDSDGYDRAGYDSAGYDKTGYNKAGYDKDGYDRDGYDIAGFDKNGYNSEGYDSNGKHKDEVSGQTGIPSYCKNQNPNLGYTINGYVSAPRQTAMLTGLNDFIVKMVPGEGRGYGMADSYATAGMTNTRTFAVSECPGDFTEHLPKQGTCIAQGEQYITLRWSYDGAVPAGKAQCRLEEGKTYYFNVRNASRTDLNKASCASGTCSSYFATTAAPLQ